MVTWTQDYLAGQLVKVRHQGGWCRARVCAIRSRSCMVGLIKSGEPTTVNIHDPRNIQPCQTDNQSGPSTSNDQLSFG